MPHGHLRPIDLPGRRAAAARLFSTWREASGQVWGEGLESDGLGTLWYPCRWSDAGAEECVLLVPFLVPAVEKNRAQIADMLLATMTRAVVRIAGRLAREADISPTRVLELIDRTEVVPGVRFTNRLSPPPRAHMAPLSAVPLWPRSRPSRQQVHSWLVAALADLSAIDTLRNAARNTEHAPATTFPRLVAGSAAAGFNAAYLFPRYRPAHECLTLAAWLGCLAKCGAAWMPNIVADALVDMARLEAARLQTAEVSNSAHSTGGSPSGDDSTISDQFASLAHVAGGLDPLVSVARRVRSSGRMRLVRTSRRRSSMSASPIAWDAELFSDLDRKLRAIPNSEYGFADA